MKLEQPERLAEDLERGLGELHWLFEKIEPSMRLRVAGVCGIGSLAIAQHLREQGHDVDLVISEPQLWVEPGMRHVFPLVHADNNELMIDVSFAQFLDFSGMSHGYVACGGENLFPEQKIAEMHNGDSEYYVSMLTDIAVRTLEGYEAPDRLFRRPQMEGMDESEIRAVYAAIWDPAYFDVYQPDEKTMAAGKRLATFILPEHVRLVD